MIIHVELLAAVVSICLALIMWGVKNLWEDRKGSRRSIRWQIKFLRLLQDGVPRTSAQIAYHFRTNPEGTGVFRDLPLPSSVTNLHLSRLVEDGLVVEKDAPGSVHLYIVTVRGLAWLALHEETPTAWRQ